MAHHAATPPGMVQLSYLFLAVLLVTAYRLGPTLSRLTRLPLITLYMLGGVVASNSGLLAEPVLEQLIPVHKAALACITFAAGSELVMEQLTAGARLVRCLTLSLCASSFVIVFCVMLALLHYFCSRLVIMRPSGMRSWPLGSTRASALAVPAMPAASFSCWSSFLRIGRTLMYSLSASPHTHPPARTHDRMGNPPSRFVASLNCLDKRVHRDMT